MCSAICFALKYKFLKSDANVIYFLTRKTFLDFFLTNIFKEFIL